MAFTSKTLKEAVQLWFEDRSKAEAAYGIIGSWDTSRVDDMSRLFNGIDNFQAKDFNEDIVSWAISYVGIM